MSAKGVLGAGPPPFGRRPRWLMTFSLIQQLATQLFGILRFPREAASAMADQLIIEQAMPRMPRATAKVVICPRSYGTGD